MQCPTTLIELASSLPTPERDNRSEAGILRTTALWIQRVGVKSCNLFNQDQLPSEHFSYATQEELSVNWVQSPLVRSTASSRTWGGDRAPQMATASNQAGSVASEHKHHPKGKDRRDKGGSSCTWQAPAELESVPHSFCKVAGYRNADQWPSPQWIEQSCIPDQRLPAKP